MTTNSDAHPLLLKFDHLEFSRFLGIRIDSIEKGVVYASLKIEDKHKNLMSSLHGGVMYAAADAIGFAALLTVLDHRQSAATVDISVSVLRSCAIGDTLNLKGSVVKLTRKGRESLRRAYPLWKQVQCNVIGRLDQKKQDQLENLLSELTAER